MKHDIEKCSVTKWFPEKGFGFLAVGGRRAFVHVSDITPYQGQGVDLSNQTLVVYATEEGEKGLRVMQAATLVGHKERLLQQAEEDRQQKIRRAEEKKRQDAREAKELAFRAEYPALLQAWKDELDAKAESYLSRVFLSPGAIFLEPDWIRNAPYDLVKEVNSISAPLVENIRQWARECLSRRWETIRQMSNDTAQEINLSSENFTTWFKEVSKDSYHRWLNGDDDQVKEEIKYVLIRLKRKLAWENALPVRDKIIRLARSNDETHGSWRRADLSGMTIESLTTNRPQIIVAYLGGSRSDVISGTHGNSGESWSYDLGTSSHYGQWEIRPDIAELICEGKADEALYKVRQEIAVLEASRRRAGRSVDHAWVRWVLSRTPVGATADELVTSEGRHFPQTSDVRDRAHTLAVRVLEKHSKLHAAFREAHEALYQKAEIQQVVAVSKEKADAEQPTTPQDSQETEYHQEETVPSLKEENGMNSLGNAFAKWGL